MICIASIDLKAHEDLFKSISDPNKAIFSDNGLKSNHLICDEKTKTVWLQWYNKVGK